MTDREWFGNEDAGDPGMTREADMSEFEDHCEDCGEHYEDCQCGTDPEEYPEPWDIDDHPDYDPYTGSSGADYWQNENGEWRCG